jgi:hypothetical protein
MRTPGTGRLRRLCFTYHIPAKLRSIISSGLRIVQPCFAVALVAGELLPQVVARASVPRSHALLFSLAPPLCNFIDGISDFLGKALVPFNNK